MRISPESTTLYLSSPGEGKISGQERCVAVLKTIFLDLDDTLLDFQQAERQALSRTLGRFGIAPSPAILDRYHEINRQQWELLEEGKLTRPQVLLRRFDLLFRELGIHCPSEAVRDTYEAYLSQGHFFVPGAPELLERLYPRYELYLASNGTAAVQAERLKSAGIARYFKGIFLSEEIGANKPSPDYFYACFDAIPGFDLSAALMVGDSLTSDILGARNVGMRSCWFNAKGAPPRPDIPADYTIRALEELPPLLERL